MTEPASRATARRGAPSYVVATVTLWGQTVGAVAEDARGQVVFEYDETFRRSGLEISPIHLPLSRRGPVAFPELARLPAFEGLPGVLADALPDAFGNAIIRRYFAQHGRPERALSPVQKLLYIGGRAMGALQFHPPMDVAPAAAIEEALDVSRLVREARRVIEGDASVAVPEMMQVGASAGGARAKALILWNRETNRVRSGFATPNPGDEPWIIKLDGVSGGAGGPTPVLSPHPGPFGRIEYAYAKMARAAGIDIADSFLLRERQYAHFMTKRFDRRGASRIHLHSLGGLQHVDYNQRGAFSYEQYLRTVRELKLGQPEVEQAFRRMVFNLAASNQDDHVKNMAFLMTPNGKWSLAPAYDLTYARGSAWTRTHQMTLAGKDDDFTRDDLLRIGTAMDIPRGGATILAEVDAALSTWPAAAKEADLDAAWIARVGSAFRRFG